MYHLFFSGSNNRHLFSHTFQFITHALRYFKCYNNTTSEIIHTSNTKANNQKLGGGSGCDPFISAKEKYKVVQIWLGQTVTCLHTNSPGHIWTTLKKGLRLACQGLWLIRIQAEAFPGNLHSIPVQQRKNSHHSMGTNHSWVAYLSNGADQPSTTMRFYGGPPQNRDVLLNLGNCVSTWQARLQTNANLSPWMVSVCCVSLNLCAYYKFLCYTVFAAEKVSLSNLSITPCCKPPLKVKHNHCTSHTHTRARTHICQRDCRILKAMQICLCARHEGIWRSGGRPIIPCSFNLATRCRWEVNFTPQINSPW
jgi:hypothetical protein